MCIACFATEKYLLKYSSSTLSRKVLDKVLFWNILQTKNLVHVSFDLNQRCLFWMLCVGNVTFSYVGLTKAFVISNIIIKSSEISNLITQQLLCIQ